MSRLNSFRRKTEEMEPTLWESIERLAPLAPEFVSVTYGAGGATRERTHATVARIVARNRDQARRASHLRRRDAAQKSTTSSAPTGRLACATSWLCAATRRAESAAASVRIPAAMPIRPQLVAGI